MTNTTIEIISLLKTKFNPTEAQQFANLIDERIREVAFELIKKNLDASSSTDPYLGLRWNGTGLNSAEYENSRGIQNEKKTPVDKNHEELVNSWTKWAF